MAVEVRKSYVLGDCRLEPDRRQLTRDGEPIPLTSKPFKVLLYLIEQRDRLVSRAELLDRFWQGKDVYDEALSRCMSAIRKALRDKLDAPRFIETRWAEGYRYIGPVEEQVDQVGAPVFEIERTRGVIVVVEEESGPALPEKGVPASLAQPMGASRRRRQYQMTALVMVAAVLAALMTAFIINRTGAFAPSPPATPIRSIAVLPLKNLTGDPSQDYFSDGMAESFISELSRSGELKVTSRASSFMFKDQELDPREIGKRLGVAAVLEGSVQKSEDRVRVAVRLVSVADGRILWASNAYDRTLKDIFAVQDEIGSNVARSLKLLMDGDEKPQKGHTNSVEAYQSYLQGLYHLNKRQGEDLKKAIASFQQAVAIDPNYAVAYAGLAQCYSLGMWYIPLEPREAIANTKAAAWKAVAIDDRVAEAHEALASVYSLDWDWANARTEHERAIEINPSYAQAYHGYSLYLNIHRQPAEAIENIKRAEELDPLSLPILADVAMAYAFGHRYDEAVAAYKKALELDSGYPVAHANLAETYFQMGRYDEALREYDIAISLAGRTPTYVCGLGLIYASTGRKAEAQRVLNELIQASRQSYVPPTLQAMLYAALGQKERAFSLLEEACAEHSPQMMNLLVEPGLDPLRADARFLDLLRRVGLPGE
ncbi:MAG TPA: FlgO family outer membrane protein [Blastocatellia bacterium]|nr:FlgO family outer membrane protein [Blastocatellia bacterium]